MRRFPTRSAVGAMMSVPLAARLFIGMSLDYTQSGCAGWMCPLIGLVIASPLLFCVQHAGKLDTRAVLVRFAHSAPKPVAAAILLPLMLILCADCAGIVRLTANTANINALNNVATPFLVLPAAVVVGIVLLFGGSAAARNARIWMLLLPVPLLIVVAVQMRNYEPAWLTPILGGGVASLLRNGLQCAGVISVFSLVCMLSESDDNGMTVFRPLLAAAAASSILLVLFQMLSPVRTQVVLSRASRLKMILSNGRVALILQIVMIFIWYGSILHIIAVESVTACRIAETLFPKVKPAILAPIFALGIGCFACTQIPETERMRNLEIYRFHFIGTLMLAVFICDYWIHWRKRKCEG